MTDMETGTLLERDILEHVRARSTSLSQSAQRVARLVLRQPLEVISMSAEELARTSETSVGTVMRFCQSVGRSGYQSFKMELASAVKPAEWDPHEEQLRRELATPPERVLMHVSEQLDTIMRALDYRAVNEIAVRILRAGRILILSTGPSQPIAMTLGYSLNTAGHHVSYPMDHETQAVIAERLTDRDVCFVVSHSGQSEPVLRAAEKALRGGATVLALTSFVRSPLISLTTKAIVAGAPEDAYRTADAASRPVHLAVVYSLLAAIDDARDEVTHVTPE